MFAVFVACGAGCGIDAIATGPAPAAPPIDASPNPVVHLPETGPGIDASLDAGCSDVQTPLNCGRCGHSCLDGACVAGKCAPLVMVTGESGLGAVALDTMWIYYVAEDSGLIRKIPIAGGASTAVHATGRAPHDLVFDGDRLFWADQFGAGVHVLAPAATYTFSSGAITALAKTTTGVYVIAPGFVTFWTRDFGGGQALSSNGASPAVVVDGANAYWSQAQQIWRAPYGSTGAGVENVVVGLTAPPTSLAITSTHVYWALATQVQRGTIKAPTGWTVETLATGETLAASLTVDDSGAYWLDLTTGALRHVPLAGGKAETLATFAPQRLDAPYPRQIALSATAIYVASTGDGTLSRLAK
jgi:hypothetical protein